MRAREVYMHSDLLDVVPKSGPQRRLIMEFVRSLRESPDTSGDLTDKDASLRERQIKVIGDYHHLLVRCAGWSNYGRRCPASGPIEPATTVNSPENVGNMMAA
jgi:hypothetical protein